MMDDQYVASVDNFAKNVILPKTVVLTQITSTGVTILAAIALVQRASDGFCLRIGGE